MPNMPEKEGKLMPALTSGMTSSLTDNWPTPSYVFDRLNDEFHFTLDVCADDLNHKCDRYFTKEIDGLAQEWTGTCWMNPPYGRTIGQWVKKAYDAARGGAVVVCLLPARTDTRWWRDYVMCASELRFISGRVKFGNANTGAPFPSVVAIFGTPTSPRIIQTSFEEVRA